mgnify:CR=1 FL=1|jgi:hypothetical protein
MSKVLTGGRAVISVDNQVVGVFENCSYGANIGVEPIHILGRFGPAEITPTSYEAVNISCAGFRVVGNGVHTLPKFPKLQDILNLGSVTISIRDRQSGELIMTAIGCIPTSYNSAPSARATTRISISYVGLKVSDESGDQEEAGAVSLP